MELLMPELRSQGAISPKGCEKAVTRKTEGIAFITYKRTSHPFAFRRLSQTVHVNPCSFCPNSKLEKAKR
jgi:hypothetical protein